MQRSMAAGNDDPVVVVDGVRTPFARQAGALAGWNAVQLGSVATAELLARSCVDPAMVERIVYGQVIVMPEAPNVAREVALAAGLPPATDAVSVSRACTTSLWAITDVARALLCNEIEVGVAGGTDSASNPPILLSRRLGGALTRATRSKRWMDRLAAYASIRPRDLLPRPPAVRDYSTGLRMGDIGEQMARDHGIDRQAQDAYAASSHHKATAAWGAGRLDDEVALCFPPPAFRPLHQDPPIRPHTNVKTLGKLPPVFDRHHGTVTAGNAPPLTDGASSLLLMRASRARALGLSPLGAIRSWAMTGNDPFHDGLLGPSFAVPLALERAGLRLEEVDIVEFHEALAAQVLANLKVWRSVKFAREVLGRPQPLGEADPERFNVNGGSLAFGHPFAATGGRLVVQALRELRRRQGNTALVTACAAGGLGAAMVLETI